MSDKEIEVIKLSKNSEKQPLDNVIQLDSETALTIIVNKLKLEASYLNDHQKKIIDKKIMDLHKYLTSGNPSVIETIQTNLKVLKSQLKKRMDYVVEKYAIVKEKAKDFRIERLEKKQEKTTKKLEGLKSEQ